MLCFKKNVLGNVCLGFFGPDAILAYAKSWDLVLWKCPRRSATLQSAPEMCFYLRLRRLSRMFYNYYFCRIFSLFKAQFKRRNLFAQNRIAELSACKMRSLNQLNATYFNSMRVSRIFDWSSRIYNWSSTFDLNAIFYTWRIEFKLC